MRFVVGFDESRQYLDSVGTLTRIPRSPPWLLGAFNSDGAPVPLVDMEAWAHRAGPTPWRLAANPLESRQQAAQPWASSASSLRALRMGDGADAWAIRVTQAPAVIAVESGQSRAISNQLPLSVSATNGRLMPHAAFAWFLAEAAIALQVHWSQVADAIRQELSGLATGPAPSR
jgi:CheW-like domain